MEFHWSRNRKREHTFVGLLKTRVQEDLVSPVNHVGANPTIPVMGHEAAILPRRSLLGS
jgi:hypothetical protein